MTAQLTPMSTLIDASWLDYLLVAPRENLVDPDEAALPWWRHTIPLAGFALASVIVLNFAF